MMMIPFCIPYRPRGWHDHDCVCRIDEYRLSVSQSTEVQTHCADGVASQSTKNEKITTDGIANKK